jgi:2-iminobutanoate/2-iminopropanoate deaminase
MATIERVRPFDWAGTFDFEQAWVVGDLVFTSGQGGFGPDGKVVEGGFEAQARQAVANLKMVLEAAGASLDGIVKQHIYLTNGDDLETWVKVRHDLYSPPYPAATAVVVKELALGILVEVEAVAVRGARRE